MHTRLYQLRHHSSLKEKRLIWIEAPSGPDTPSNFQRPGEATEITLANMDRSIMSRITDNTLNYVHMLMEQNDVNIESQTAQFRQVLMDRQDHLEHLEQGLFDTRLEQVREAVLQQYPGHDPIDRRPRAVHNRMYNWYMARRASLARYGISYFCPNHSTQQDPSNWTFVFRVNRIQTPRNAPANSPNAPQRTPQLNQYVRQNVQSLSQELNARQQQLSQIQSPQQRNAFLANYVAVLRQRVLRNPYVPHYFVRANQDLTSIWLHPGDRRFTGNLPIIRPNQAPQFPTPTVAQPSASVSGRPESTDGMLTQADQAEAARIRAAFDSLNSVFRGEPSMNYGEALRIMVERVNAELIRRGSNLRARINPQSQGQLSIVRIAPGGSAQVEITTFTPRSPQAVPAWAQGILNNPNINNDEQMRQIAAHALSAAGVERSGNTLSLQQGDDIVTAGSRAVSAISMLALYARTGFEEDGDPRNPDAHQMVRDAIRNFNEEENGNFVQLALAQDSRNTQHLFIRPVNGITFSDLVTVIAAEDLPRVARNEQQNYFRVNDIGRYTEQEMDRLIDAIRRLEPIARARVRLEAQVFYHNQEARRRQLFEVYNQHFSNVVGGLNVRHEYFQSLWDFDVLIEQPNLTFVQLTTARQRVLTARTAFESYLRTNPAVTLPDPPDGNLV